MRYIYLLMEKPDLSKWPPDVQRRLEKAPNIMEILLHHYAGLPIAIEQAEKMRPAPMSDVANTLARRRCMYQEYFGVKFEHHSALLADARSMAAYADAVRPPRDLSTISMD